MDELTSEQIYGELRKLARYGVIEYVEPSDPLGEKWVLGVRGMIVTYDGDDEACAFLAGASATAYWFDEDSGLAAREV